MRPGGGAGMGRGRARMSRFPLDVGQVWPGVCQRIFIAVGPIMSRHLSRRQFFGRPGGRNAPIRPPFSVGESDFVDRCSRCDACIRACAPGILIRGDGGFPALDFRRGACTFCRACADACPDGAFARRGSGRPWDVTATVEATCLDMKGTVCRLCRDRCDEDAIRFRPALGGRFEVIIDGRACTGCGACLGVCPVNAIVMAHAIEEREPA